MTDFLTSIGERFPWPDGMTRAVIRRMVGQTDKRLSGAPEGTTAAFAEAMKNYPVALHTASANEQHYEVPARFFELVLGPKLKYSSCYFEAPESTLADAERSALAQTAAHAALADGQKILELGCGWGSLSLWMASHYPHAEITAVSNSASQRAHILAQCQKRGLSNLTVITADMNSFDIKDRFDRVVSVEMFEHMSNWPALLGRIRGWLKPDGRVFIHVFTHAHAPYRFDHTNPSDWIAAHFFTGGIMPSHDLMAACDADFEVEDSWQWSGDHYQRTADAWLSNFDLHRSEIDQVLRETYGRDAALWRRRWRLFFLATSGLFGYNGGDRWGISHYRLRPL